MCVMGVKRGLSH